MPEDLPLGTLLRRHRRAAGYPKLVAPPSRTSGCALT